VSRISTKERRRGFKGEEAMESSPCKRIRHQVVSSGNLDDLVGVDPSRLDKVSKRLDPPIRGVRRIRPVEAVN
jgi:hypothetical protein